MKFLRKRGRPKKKRDKVDLGTKELQEKKRLFFSDSLLIMLKKQNIIDEIEYQTALWFRYLYSVKFGNPNIITAYNTAKIQGFNSFVINEKKQEKVEKIYNKISCELQNRGLKNVILDVCVFDKQEIILQLNNKYYLEKLKNGLKVINFYNLI